MPSSLSTKWGEQQTRQKRQLVPDFFSNKPFFEKDGFAFLIDTEVHDGTCHLCVWFQNRYEQPCKAMVMVRTAERLLAPQRDLPDAKVSITCLPAAYGKAVAPWALPPELQGRKILLDVMASRKYPRDRGRLLRNRAGLPVGSLPRSAVLDVLGALGVLGGLHTGRPARIEIQLPQNVATTAGTTQERIETIWKLGDPPDFPVAA